MLGLAACRDSKVEAYRIPKEHDTPPPAAAPPGLAGPESAPAAGELEWSAPADWKAKPGAAMRKGTYAIGAAEGPGAELAITVFPGNVGGDLANVNRWRGQLSLPLLGEAELGTALTPLAANGLTMQVADLAGGPADNPVRMLGAIVPHAGATWFFKLTGPAAVVAKAQPAYLEFLKTLKPAAAPAAPAAIPAAAAPPPADMAGTPVVKAAGPGLRWTAPAHWQEKPAGSMRKATFGISGANGGAAELAVTAFPGEVGGDLANLNRWRGQLSLPPVSETEFAGAVTRLTVNGLPVTLADLTGGAADNPTRLLGAMVPYGGSTWFFKLTGPAALVAAEKPAFLNFVQSLSAP
ncbi:MAG: hypothetical protein HYX71_06960 [Opitutae bacterium]|nr:hypothetical protein [Opitutae bacterium]